MSNRWPVVPLNEVLTQYREYIDQPEPRQYPKLSVKLYGRGVVLDAPVDGSSLKMKRHQVAKAGQVILSEIWGKKGAIGFVPQDGDGALCTSHFFLFDVNRHRVEPGWLNAIFRANYLAEQLESQAFGTTGYAAVRPKALLAAKIPLPPLEEQQRIVARIDRLATKIDEAQQLFRGRLLELRAIQKSTSRKLIGDEPTPHWIPLHSVIVDIENGWSPQCMNHPATNGKWGVLKVGAVSFGTFDPRQNKELPESLEPIPRYEIKAGDFLMCRANTVELVGACALVDHTPNRLMLCDKIFRFRFDPKSELDPAFLNHALKSPALRTQIEAGATGTSPTMRNISKAKIMNLRIPVPSIPEQKRIVALLDRLQAQAEELQLSHRQTALELNAMLPSILDRAFKGEL